MGSPLVGGIGIMKIMLVRRHRNRSPERSAFACVEGTRRTFCYSLIEAVSSAPWVAASALLGGWWAQLLTINNMGNGVPPMGSTFLVSV